MLLRHPLGKIHSLSASRFLMTTWPLAKQSFEKARSQRDEFAGKLLPVVRVNFANY
jgi:hypothetical protein